MQIVYLQVKEKTARNKKGIEIQGCACGRRPPTHHRKQYCREQPPWPFQDTCLSKRQWRLENLAARNTLCSTGLICKVFLRFQRQSRRPAWAEHAATTRRSQAHEHGTQNHQHFTPTSSFFLHREKKYGPQPKLGQY